MLKMVLEQKMIIIEEIISRKLMTRENGCELTETDRMMIRRLVKNQELTNEQIIEEVLNNHKS